MNPERFWSYVASMGGASTPRAVANLRKELARADDDAEREFAANLEEKLRVLTDGSASLRLESALRADRDLGISEDLKLLAACAVISSGRENYELWTAESAPIPPLPSLENGDELLGLCSSFDPSKAGQISSHPRRWLGVVLGDSQLRARRLVEAMTDIAIQRVVDDGKYDIWLEEHRLKRVRIHLSVRRHALSESMRILSRHDGYGELDVESVIGASRLGRIAGPGRLVKEIERALDEVIVLVDQQGQPER